MDCCPLGGKTAFAPRQQCPVLERLQIAAEPKRWFSVVATSGRQVGIHAIQAAERIVGLLHAKNSFLANLAVFKTSANMTGTLLDALA